MNDSLEMYGLTHIGRVKQNNEDNYYLNPEKGIAFVADGMGGHECGEVASALAVLSIQENASIYESTDYTKEMGAKWLEEAHYQICQSSLGKGSRSMGTTAVLALIHEKKTYVSWVGDSRAYMYSDGKIHHLSKDHSVVQQMIDAKVITELQARTHERRNVITQSLGGGGLQIYPDTNFAYLSKNNILILFSDGLNEELDDEEIKTCIRSGGGLQAICERLVYQALEKGAKDNVTVVLVKTP